MAVETNSYVRLEPYYEAARQETEVRQQTTPIGQLEALGDAGQQVRTQSFIEAIRATSDMAVIAEHKRRSPNRGDLKPDSEVQWAVQQYQQGGAAALSVVTQNKHFGGSVADLTEASLHSTLPILRKDFIDTEYQLYEARAYGAAAVLLIVGGLSDIRLKHLYKEAGEIGLDCLIEVHDQEELDRALEVEPELIGINTRDLRTQEIEVRTPGRLAPQIPTNITTVAESGYPLRFKDGSLNYVDVKQLRLLGISAMLIGTALMRDPNPAETLAAWLSMARNQQQKQ